MVELENYLKLHGFNTVFTYAGICFWDDKYPDDEARLRLINSVHASMGPLLNVIGEAREVLMTIQPSDDCYHKDMVKDTQEFFRTNKDVHVYGYRKGYVMDYVKGQIKEWNPKTTPPFYTIRFPRDMFVDPLKHLKYTGPYKSHEYVKDFLPVQYMDFRGFVVGTHGENISTVFNHPFAGEDVPRETLVGFGLESVKNLKLKISARKWLMRKLPHGWQRKLRYWVGERFFARIYNFLRN